MVTKWMEIDSEIFYTVFNKFWNLEKNDKVLEIQNFQAISDGNPEVRIFFGNKINITDYEYWNKEAVKMIKVTDMLNQKLGGSIKSFSDSRLSVCFLEAGGPRITPFGSVPSHYELVCSSFFGERPKDKGSILDKSVSTKRTINLWYNKKENSDKYYFTYDFPTVDRKRYFRVRVYDFENWEGAIGEYIKYGRFPGYLETDDITPSKVVITSSPDDKVSNPYK